MHAPRLLTLCALALATSCGPLGGSGTGGGTGTGGGAAGGGSGGGGGSAAADAGATTLPPGPAIVADAGVWTWVDFPDSQCGNGVPTGLGINPSPGASTDVVLYLQGGGACWDQFSCFGFGQGGSAAHLADGYTASTFAGETIVNQSFFNRGLAGNPFAGASFAFIPYCTGDVHAGDSVKLYAATSPQVHHHGARNIEAFLARLRTTFPSATRVFLTGSSAGAFGAQLNYPRVVAAFPSAEVHVLADSGQMINPNGLLPSWRAAWGFTVPADCVDCATDFSKFPSYLVSKYPTRRFALLAYTQDGVLSLFFNRIDGSFETLTRSLLTTAYDGHPNAGYFVLAGTDHTMLGSVSTLTAPGGPTLLTWLNRWASGDAAWASVKPAP